MKNKKKSEDGLGKGGVGGSSSVNHEEMEAGVVIGGKSMEKLRNRQKSLSKSRNTHMAKLQAARNKMVARSRT